MVLWADLLRPEIIYSTKSYTPKNKNCFPMVSKEDLRETCFRMGEKTFCDDGKVFTTLYDLNNPLVGAYAFVTDDFVKINGTESGIAKAKSSLEKLFKTELVEVEN